MIFDVNGVSLNLPKHNWASGDIVSHMVADNYKIADLDFDYGDWIIDVGGHMGEVALNLANRFPFVNIISFEPIYPSYLGFVENIQANDAKNVRVYHLAITGDGRDVLLDVDLIYNSGGASFYIQDKTAIKNHSIFFAKSITLDQVFEIFNIEKCKLFKIDCEGAEYEILYNCKYLNRIDNFRAEFHENNLIRKKGYSIEELGHYCFERVGNIYFEKCEMAR